MRLTTFTDYSLRVLIFLAAEPAGRATIAQIARAFDISENHLMKVVHFLGKAGLLANVRGKGGGLGLARPADQINLGEVVRITEANANPAECFDRERNQCVIAPICKLKDVFFEAERAFHKVLDGYTLDDVVRNRTAISRVLFSEKGTQTPFLAPQTAVPPEAPAVASATADASVGSAVAMPEPVAARRSPSAARRPTRARGAA